MKKKIIYNNSIRSGKLLSNGEDSIVVELGNGSILKMFKKDTIEIYESCGFDLEKKILDAVPIKNSPEILIPNAAAYNENGSFLGYTMPKAKGIDFNLYDKSLSPEQRKNLKKYAGIHYKLESVLRRNKDIVFPDFCTCENIFVDKNGNIQFIDYDGMQVGTHGALALSTSVGDYNDIISSPKYFGENLLYKKELDKRSSIILYFLHAFNIDLTKVGQISPKTGKKITLDDIFESLNLDDFDLCHKVWKIFQSNEQNEFLGDDVFRIADIYDLNLIAPGDSFYIKRLERKR